LENIVASAPEKKSGNQKKKNQFFWADKNKVLDLANHEEAFQILSSMC
jgi:hypothetical protein